jgi:hypothetical protein
VDREPGIARFKQCCARLAGGDIEGLPPLFKVPEGPPPVFPVILKTREDRTPDTVKFEFVAAEGHVSTGLGL